MPQNTNRVDQRIELGRALVVKYLQDVMLSKDVDPVPMLFIWEQDAVHAQWTLTVYYGRSKYRLRFMERDILGWPWSRAVLSGKYERGFRGLIDKVRAA